MRGVPNFNRSNFDYYAAQLRAEGHNVFSPAESSEQIYGPQIYKNNPEGDEARAGVNGRLVFAFDLAWICHAADAIALIPGWETSMGTRAELAVAHALGLKVIDL